MPETIMPETIKKPVEIMYDLSKKNYSIKKISKVIRIFTALLLVCIYLDNKKIFGTSIFEINLNLWDKSFRDFINKDIFWTFIIWIGYKNIISVILKRLCIRWGLKHMRYDEIKKSKSIPILFTVDDLVDFSCTIYFGLYAINQMIEWNNLIIIYDKKTSIVSIVAGIYLFVIFVSLVFEQNRNRCYHIFSDPTPYYDVNNKRIFDGASVIYQGKSYTVSNTRYDTKREWILDAEADNTSSILLKDAAKNRAGRLTIIPVKEYEI